MATTFTLDGAIATLDSAKAQLRARSSPRARVLAERCTAYEDWLEFNHPRATALRADLRDARRRLEVRS